jgi:NitT/TauT family transport system substrate-binding protein
VGRPTSVAEWAVLKERTVMTVDRAMLPGRRRMLQGVGALSLSLAGGALLTGCGQVAPFFAGSKSTRPETNTIKLPSGFATCVAPEILAVDMLRAEGFEVKQVQVGSDAEIYPAIAAGEIDLAMRTAASKVPQADTSNAFVHLAGIHTGCFELFASTGVRSLNDLKGKRVAAYGVDAGIYFSAMAAYIGLDPQRDLTLETYTAGDEAIEGYKAGRFDAIMAGPPQPQQLRKAGYGHVLTSMHSDRPWSQQFCCMLVANREFVQNNPVAAKQAVRAILKATDLCATKPGEAAQLLIDRGDITDRDAAFEMFTHDASYDKWREYDPEATLRFYGLLLHQIGKVKTPPDQLIAQSTDWRILNELKKELKG